MTFRISNSLKITAFLTLLIFSAQSLLQAAPVSLETSVKSKKVISASPFLKSPKPSISIDRGRVQEQFLSHSTPFIYLVEDAHDSLDAQESIRQILKQLVEKENVSLVCFEGGSEKLDRSFYDFAHNSSKNEKIWDQLFKQGQIGGLERYALEASDNVKFSGLENKKVYFENIHSIQKIFREKEKVQNVLKQIDVVFDELDGKLVTGDAKKVRDLRKSFDDGRLNLIQYAKELIKSSNRNQNIVSAQTEWPQMARLIKLQEFELKLKQQESGIQKELEQVKKKTSSDLSFIWFPEQHEKVRGHLRWYFEKAVDQGLNFKKYPNLSNWVGYQILQDEISAADLFEEIEQLETDVLSKLDAPVQTKTFLKLDHDYVRVKKLISLEVSRKEWNQLKRDNLDLKPLAKQLCALYKETFHHKPRISVWDALRLISLFKSAKSNYEIVEMRDTILSKRIKEQVAVANAKKVVVITGGFHTDMIVAFLKGQQIGYAVISPVISDVNNKLNYRKLIDPELSKTRQPEVSSFGTDAEIQPFQAVIREKAFAIAKSLGRGYNTDFGTLKAPTSDPLIHRINCDFVFIERVIKKAREKEVPEALLSAMCDPKHGKIFDKLAQAIRSRKSPRIRFYVVDHPLGRDFFGIPRYDGAILARDTVPAYSNRDNRGDLCIYVTNYFYKLMLKDPGLFTFILDHEFYEKFTPPDKSHEQVWKDRGWLNYFVDEKTKLNKLIKVYIDRVAEEGDVEGLDRFKFEETEKGRLIYEYAQKKKCEVLSRSKLFLTIKPEVDDKEIDAWRVKKAIANHGVNLEIQYAKFENEERYAHVPDPEYVKGKECTLFFNKPDSNRELIKLLFAVELLEDCGAKKITLILPANIPVWLQDTLRAFASIQLVGTKQAKDKKKHDQLPLHGEPLLMDKKRVLAPAAREFDRILIMPNADKYEWRGMHNLAYLQINEKGRMMVPRGLRAGGHYLLIAMTDRHNEVLRLLETLSLLARRNIHPVVFVPYFSYGRQHMAYPMPKYGPKAISSNSARAILKTASQFTSRIYGVNLHFTKHPGEVNVGQEFPGLGKYVQIYNVNLFPQLVRHFQTHEQLTHPVIVGADKGAHEFALEASRATGIEYGGHMSKGRDSSQPTHLQIDMKIDPEKLPVDVAGRDVILLDDIIASGGTIINAALLLKSRGAKRIFVGTVYGEFTKGIEIFHNQDVIKKQLDKLKAAGQLTDSQFDRLNSKLSRVPLINGLKATDILLALNPENVVSLTSILDLNKLMMNSPAAPRKSIYEGKSLGRQKEKENFYKMLAIRDHVDEWDAREAVSELQGSIDGGLSNPIDKEFALEIVRDGLKHSNPMVRERSALIIGNTVIKYFNRLTNELPSLIAHLDDPDERVRLAAVIAIGWMHQKRVGSHLWNVMGLFTGDDDRDDPGSRIETRPDGTRVVVVVSTLMSRGDITRPYQRAIFWRWGTTTPYSSLKAERPNPSREKSRILEFLDHAEQFGLTQDIPLLDDFVNHPNPEIQAAAKHTVSHIRWRAEMPKLMKQLLDSQASPASREAAVKSFAVMEEFGEVGLMIALQLPETACGALQEIFNRNELKYRESISHQLEKIIVDQKQPEPIRWLAAKALVKWNPANAKRILPLLVDFVLAKNGHKEEAELLLVQAFENEAFWEDVFQEYVMKVWEDHNGFIARIIFSTLHRVASGELKQKAQDALYIVSGEKEGAYKGSLRSLFLKMFDNQDAENPNWHQLKSGLGLTMEAGAGLRLIRILLILQFLTVHTQEKALAIIREKLLEEEKPRRVFEELILLWEHTPKKSFSDLGQLLKDISDGKIIPEKKKYQLIRTAKVFSAAGGFNLQPRAAAQAQLSPMAENLFALQLFSYLNDLERFMDAFHDSEEQRRAEGRVGATEEEERELSQENQFRLMDIHFPGLMTYRGRFLQALNVLLLYYANGKMVAEGIARLQEIVEDLSVGVLERESVKPEDHTSYEGRWTFEMPRSDAASISGQIAKAFGASVQFVKNPESGKEQTIWTLPKSKSPEAQKVFEQTFRKLKLIPEGNPENFEIIKLNHSPSSDGASLGVGVAEMRRDVIKYFASQAEPHFSEDQLMDLVKQDREPETAAALVKYRFMPPAKNRKTFAKLALMLNKDAKQLRLMEEIILLQLWRKIKREEIDALKNEGKQNEILERPLGHLNLFGQTESRLGRVALGRFGPKVATVKDVLQILIERRARYSTKDVIPYSEEQEVLNELGFPIEEAFQKLPKKDVSEMRKRLRGINKKYDRLISFVEKGKRGELFTRPVSDLGLSAEILLWLKRAGQVYYKQDQEMNIKQLLGLTPGELGIPNKVFLAELEYKVYQLGYWLGQYQDERMKKIPLSSLDLGKLMALTEVKEKGGVEAVLKQPITDLDLPEVAFVVLRVFMKSLFQIDQPTIGDLKRFNTDKVVGLRNALQEKDFKSLNAQLENLAEFSLGNSLGQPDTVSLDAVIILQDICGGIVALRLKDAAPEIYQSLIARFVSDKPAGQSLVITGPVSPMALIDQIKGHKIVIVYYEDEAYKKEFERVAEKMKEKGDVLQEELNRYGYFAYLPKLHLTRAEFVRQVLKNVKVDYDGVGLRSIGRIASQSGIRNYVNRLVWQGDENLINQVIEKMPVVLGRPLRVTKSGNDDTDLVVLKLASLLSENPEALEKKGLLVLENGIYVPTDLFYSFLDKAISEHNFEKLTASMA